MKLLQLKNNWLYNIIHIFQSGGGAGKGGNNA